MATSFAAPARRHYDVVIVGGAIMGSSTAWWLTELADFTGSVLVVEREPTYEFASTSRSNSCIRLQFSAEINVRVSQFAADFIHDLRRYLGGDERVPRLRINNFGYLYLAADEAGAEVLRQNQAVQLAVGAGTRLLGPDEIAAEFPFYSLDDVVLGSINTVDEGYWDGITVFDWLRRSARERGTEYVANEVVGMTRNAGGDRVESVRLATGETIGCGHVVNATGPRAARTARMAGIDNLPVEPRKRYSWVFSASRPLEQVLPLTIDSSGVHFRQDGATNYLVGGHADHDPAADFDDFEMDHELFEAHIWPAMARRIPRFESIRVTNEWVGHYEYNVLDQNAVVGPHTEVGNFLFLNGFSGHGLQQSPAMGRGTAEWLTYGEYRTLDLSPFHFERIVANRPFLEKAII